MAAWSRIIIASILAATTIAAFRGSLLAPTPSLLLGTTAFVLLLSVISLTTARWTRLHSPLGVGQISTDLALASIAVYLTGGAESAFSILFHLSVIVGAFFFGSRGAWMTMLASVACYFAVTLSLEGEVITSPPDLLASPELAPREIGYYLGINITSLTIVAALSGYLAQRERATGGKLVEARRTTADLAALNEDIVRSLTIGLAAIDAQGSLLWLNPGGSEILDNRSPAILDDLLADLSEDAVTGELTEKRLIREDGQEVILNFRLTPLLDGRGESRGRLLVFQDVTEMHEMQAKVERSERLAALGRLAAGLAHELRNPLGSISGSLQLIQENPKLDEDERRLVDVMLRELDRLADLVTQMLDLARPRSPHFLPVDLTPVLEEVVEVIKRSAETEELELNLDLPDQVLLIADSDHMRQLFWNLLRNAVQASTPGSTVVVRAQATDQEVTVEISDAGPGITAEDRNKIFEPFFSTKRGGIGMGLAVCKQVVNSHSGTIELEDADPTGTLFRVRLPTELEIRDSTVGRE